MAASDMRNRRHVQLLLTWSTNAAHPSLRQDDLQTVSSTEDLTPLDIMTGRDVVPYDIMTGRPYEEQDWSANNTELYNLFKHRQTSPQTQFLCETREEILRTIEEDPVVLIHGQTGCGKTTQVPQYILEKAAMDGHGSDVNIVVTQPRRISALSIAGSVAHELGEPLGCTVGYQIRLDKILPSRRRGAILFCSTGILLRHLQANRGELPGVTHVIVDEAHERDIQIDLLLTLLREKVRHPDSKLRLILMSASFNTKLFSSYFNYCPVVDVPGMSFPVKEHYLPEILQELGQDPNSFWEGSMFTEQLGHLICQVVKHIDDSRPPGKAILVFLPGWQEIKWVHDQLKDNPGSVLFPSSKGLRRLLLLPTHSRLSPTEQMAIFKPAPTGLRKVVLATNIAESSITVEDVVYVVDPGLHKEAYIHRSAPSLRSCWASQANIVQRRGRAGRVLPGEAFHLFSQETLASMDPHPCPEILRVPLEGIILEAM
ncbi:DHX30, partial [Cordylochernes scorpioides]